ncbi:metal transporter [Flavobacterium sp. XN-5]|uniref:heavy-metal-associated domain-containing protein n=1 Tax=Flavobacterium sp. XN-5 TaxID=2599390 RepID=UPI0011C8DF85|nr:metal transporter [Flavobacterium sp. XN-5]NGY36141.1 metal transporter [Flavobacterium sp. XN-5]
MKKIIVIIALVFIGFSAQAQEKKNKNAKYTVAVNGNCEMCKKRIEKAAYGTSGVKSAIWNVDTHVLDLVVNEQKTSLLNVEKAVAKEGHDTKGVKATQEQYNSLHGCCMYERK